MPNPSVVAGNTNSGSFTTGTAVTVSSTGSVNAGDLMMCVLTVGGASAPSALTPPAGWTTFLTTTANVAAGLIVTAIFYRAQPATGSFSGSFTWTTTATSGSWGFFVLNQPGALLVDGSVVSAQNASATNTSPTITPGAGNVGDTLICAIIGAVVGADTITQPAGMTSIVNLAGTASQPFFSIASLALASSSATGTKTWTVPTSRTNLGVSLLVQQTPLWGFNVVNDAAPALPSYENRVAARVGSIVTGDAGIEARFVAKPLLGFEPNIPPPRNGNPTIQQRAAGASGKSTFAPFNLSPWPDTQSWQPYLRLGRKGALMPIEPGIQGSLAAWRNSGWEIQAPQPPHPRPERSAAAMRGDDGSQATEINFFNFGWSIILHQPQHPRPERAGALALGDTGTEAVFIQTVVATPSVFEAQLPSLPNANPSVAKRGAGASGRSSFAASSLTPWPDVLAWQPLYFRTVHRGAMAPGESGLPAAPVVVPSFGWWDIQSPMLRIAPTTRQRYPGTKGSSQFRIFPDLVNMGWEVQPPPPPRYPRTAQRGTAASGKSSFAAFNLTAWAEIQNWQPMYPRAAHRGAMVPGDPGNEAKFVPPVTGPILWGLDETPFAKRNLYRAGTFTERDVETPLINFFPFGWMVQPVQPGHPNPEKRAAGIARGDDGTQAQRINFFPIGWEVQPIQPGHPAPEKRAGGIAKGDEGNAAPQINFFPAGWQVQPHQPQHPRPERAGAIMVGEPGNEGVFAFIAPVFIPDGYNPTAFMPRVRFARAGGIARGEDGTEGLYSVWLPSGWQRPDPSQRARRGAAGAIQEEWRGGEQPEPVAGWGFDLPTAMLRRQVLRTPDQTTFVPVSAVASFTWGDLDSGVLARTRRRLRSDDVPFSPHALGARFQWGQIDPAMTFPTRRRTLTRAEFHIEGKFVFIPPLPLNIVFNPDNLLRRSFFHPGAAIMQFDGGWFQQRYVSVFFASSIITQASGDTAVTAATGQTVLSNQA